MSRYVSSDLSRAARRDRERLRVEIFRCADDPRWSVEVIAEDGIAFAARGDFELDTQALDAAPTSLDDAAWPNGGHGRRFRRA